MADPTPTPTSNAETTPSPDPRDNLRIYLEANNPTLTRLNALRKTGWQNPTLSHTFSTHRLLSTSPTSSTKDTFYHMMLSIGLAMHTRTWLFAALARRPNTDTPPSPPAILDLGMAPGGFSGAALAKHPDVLIRGVSLPVSAGGHEIRIPAWETNPNISIRFADVTMLAADMDISPFEIPASHPDHGKFLHERVFPSETFDIVFCGAQVSRDQTRAAYREGREHFRLRTSQLVLAMQRLRQGGSLVVLLGRADSWETAVFLRGIDAFSKSLELFKGEGAHAKRSTFYAVAQGVDVEGEAARAQVEAWKAWWRVCTLGSEQECEEMWRVGEEEVEELIEGFGRRLLHLAAPVWKTQADALGRVLEKDEVSGIEKGWRGKGGRGAWRRKNGWV
ncbi:hypothetical protein B0T16DRAFT_129169 [Cercophora newfieldiana]|uniref:Ribosomal RNA methyltransferase FtsJ domain-containing protein n=1 Tax=Cercophora newfieldiana TaxID=92897 RepID=A0AA39YBM9_9PEZI|nr:hypothetical protein B0T16DRAFT_129169 [Cercophora newfieldiana]